MAQLGPFEADDGLLIVVEPGDSPDELERVCGFSLLHDPFEDVSFGHPLFVPTFDYLERHDDDGKLYCFEAHTDTGDDGIGVTLFIPAEEGVPADLLLVCDAHATPAAALTEA
jgi:hypothetical protein